MGLDYDWFLQLHCDFDIPWTCIRCPGYDAYINGFARYALFCLAFSGLCDMFDGKVARTKANRTEDEKRFGIQIDSLCDVVCFGAFPMILCYSMGMRGLPESVSWSFI